MTDEILPVRRIFNEGGDWCCKCPHCREVVYLPSGPIRGEIFQHKLSRGGGCQGWFEVPHNATATLP